MSGYDVVCQPSTADVLLGARARGPARDSRTVIELDDFDFNPNAEVRPTSSASSCMKDPATGLDIVDPDELKKRIRGEGSVPPVVERLRRQVADKASDVMQACAEKAKEQPRLSLGLFVSLLLLVMFGCIYLTMPDATGQASAARPGSDGSSVATKHARFADEVKVDVVKVDGVKVEKAAGEVSVDESNEEEKKSGATWNPLSWGKEFLAIQKQNQGMMDELKELRREVAGLTELLKSSKAASATSVQGKVPRAQTAPREVEDGEREVRTEVQVEKQAAAPSPPARSEPQEDAPVILQETGGLGEVRVQQNPAAESQEGAASGEAKPSSGWSGIFAR